MRKKTVAAVLTVGLLTGGGAALLIPSSALAAGSTTSAADTSATDRVAARLGAVKNALKGLVGDGTLTQAQADKVASTLSTADLGGPGGGRGGHFGGDRVSPEATAKLIGITVAQLQTAQQAGQTLTQIAKAHNVAKADLISGLVATAKTELAADVKAGRITQAQADQFSADLTTRITARVDQAGFGRGGGFGGGPGNGGPGDGGPGAPNGGGSTSATTPTASAS